LPRRARLCRWGWARLLAALLVGRGVDRGGWRRGVATTGTACSSSATSGPATCGCSAPASAVRLAVASAAAARGASGRLLRLTTRLAWARIAGSRSFSWTNSGVAMKIDEYAPAAIPTNSASARSFSGPEPSWKAPTYRIAPTGSSAIVRRVSSAASSRGRHVLPEACGTPVASRSTGRRHRGILVCGSGAGAAIAACKMTGIRAAICHDLYSAHQAVEHDDMNVLCLGSEIVGPSVARELVEIFLAARYDGGGRYAARLEKVAAMEREMKES